MNNLITQLMRCGQQGDRETAKLIITTELNQNVDHKLNWLAIAKLSASLGLIELTKNLLNNTKPYISSLEHYLIYFSLLIDIGQQQQAYQEAMNLEKNSVNNFALAHFLGTLAAQLGFFSDSEQFLKKALALNPLSGESWLAFCELTLTKPQTRTALNTIINSLNQKPQLTINSIASMYSAAAKLSIKLGEQDQAIKLCEIAAHIKSTSSNYNPLQEQRLINNIMQTAKHFTRVANKSDNEMFKPIFIIGLPRSGTTLLEQLIASQPKVNGIGESNAIGLACMPYLVNQMIGSDTNTLKSLSNQATLDAIKHDYFSFIKAKFGVNNFVVDKSLTNSRYLSVILSLFPNASIIHIERNVQDNAWSCFKTYFSKGLDWSWSYKNIAHFIGLEQKLIDFWKNYYPDKIYSIKYENLVESPESTFNDIAEFCQLPDFRLPVKMSTNSFVKTASSSQVRQSITTCSIDSALVQNPYI